ncbi:MAG: permease [Anaerolineales bacterium]|nr:permease [Anaerolineales bacterium]
MRRVGSYAAVGALAVGSVAVVLGLTALNTTSGPWTAGLDALSAFVTTFLSIFIEAAPFLLLGTTASGLVEVFVSRDQVERWTPRGPVGGALAGALLGLCLPVGECGVAPLTRRLFRKGLPPPVGVAFWLGAPVINPVVIASTMAAFGAGRVLALRLGLTVLIAVMTGLVFAAERRPERLLRTTAEPPRVEARAPWRAEARRALVMAMDEFFELGRYLVAGGLLAALAQTAIPQVWLTTQGAGPVSSVAAAMTLAGIRSGGATVDAFSALGLAGTFTPGAILAFLVSGPMVDIKNTLLLLGVFRQRAAARLVLLPLLMALELGVAINLGAPR